jgi:hypothetical protein
VGEPQADQNGNDEIEVPVDLTDEDELEPDS